MLLKKLFILMDILINGKSLMKNHCLKKKKFYNLNLKSITDSNYNDAKTICKDFEIKNLGEYHDLYLKSDLLLLADVSKNFRKIC